MKIPALFLACLLSLIAKADTLNITGVKTREEANRITFTCFEGMGMDIQNKTETSFAVKFGGYRILISPNVGTENGDYMIAYVTFGGVGKSNTRSEQLASLANKINHRFNYMTMFIDDDGDVTVRYCLLFDKKIEPKLILKWLRKIESQTDLMSKDFGKELAPFLK